MRRRTRKWSCQGFTSSQIISMRVEPSRSPPKIDRGSFNASNKETTRDSRTFWHSHDRRQWYRAWYRRAAISASGDKIARCADKDRQEGVWIATGCCGCAGPCADGKLRFWILGDERGLPDGFLLQWKLEAARHTLFFFFSLLLPSVFLNSVQTLLLRDYGRRAELTHKVGISTDPYLASSEEDEDVERR